MEKIMQYGEKFYGRIKTRSLSVRQENLYKTLMSEIGIKSYKEADTSSFQRIFLEIGFGSGEHIAYMAMNNPKDLFIGCEPFVNGVASLLVKIEENGIKNIRIYQADARIMMKEVPSNSLAGVFLLFPDPWAKRKHIKRRFLQNETIDSIWGKLKIGGFWRIASDHEAYKAWMLRLFSQDQIRDRFDVKTFNKESRPDITNWAQTRYEQKATGDILYMECVKKRSSDEINQET